MTMNDFIFKDETYRIPAACFEVCKEALCGFLEAAYRECPGLPAALDRIR